MKYLIFIFLSFNLFAQSPFLLISDDIDITAASIPTTLAAVGDISKIALTWTDPPESDLDSIKIYRGTSTDPTTLIATISQGIETYIDTPLIQNIYFYRIKSKDRNGNLSDYSDNVNDTAYTNLIVNGTMEANSNWTGSGIEAGDSVNQSSKFAHNGTYSWRILTDVSEGVISDDFSITNGGVYIWTYWVKCELVGAQNIRLQAYYGGEGATVNFTVDNTTAWQKVMAERTATGTGGAKFWVFQTSGTKMNVYIDDVTVVKKQ